MNTEERPGRPAGTRSRSAPPHARRRIPLPSLPTFRKVTGKGSAEEDTAPGERAKPETPPANRPAVKPTASGVSQEETDLLLGGTLDDDFESLIGSEEDVAEIPQAPREGEPPERESSDRPPVAQAAESAMAEPPERSGAPGADILNDLVEEIEKDLEEEVNRLTLQTQRTLPAYRKTIPCSFVPAARPDIPKRRSPREDS